MRTFTGGQILLAFRNAATFTEETGNRKWQAEWNNGAARLPTGRNTIRAVCSLRDRQSVMGYLRREQPRWVKVGGLIGIGISLHNVEEDGDLGLDWNRKYQEVAFGGYAGTGTAEKNRSGEYEYPGWETDYNSSNFDNFRVPWERILQVFPQQLEKIPK